MQLRTNLEKFRLVKQIYCADLGNGLKVNGEAIYDADPSPVRNPDLPITHKPGRLFFHVKEQVNRELEITGMTAALTRCYLLGDSKKTALNFSQSGDRISLSLPRDAFVGGQGLVSLQPITKVRLRFLIRRYLLIRKV